MVASSALLELTKTAAAAVRRGHPWIYREGVARATKGLAAGSSVEVAEAGEVVARGLWDPTSPIAVRVYAAGPGKPIEDMDLASLAERAIARRDALFGDGRTTAYRAVNGEGDRIPGLVVDRYGEVAILRTDGDAMAARLEGLRGPLIRCLESRGVRSIALRHPGATGDAPKISTWHGPAPPERFFVRENEMSLEVDVHRGQKTGAFLDQRDNRLRVRDLASGRRVLNLFSYTGGFSIAAALGGAASVTSVDTASAAHASAQRTFRANGVDPRAHRFVSADVMRFLSEAAAEGARFDLVISDPPSFAKNERSVGRALQAYRQLHGAIAKLLAEGATFCAASCSSHVGAEDFLATLDDRALGRSDLTLAGLFGAPADHPSLPAFPEGRYLKLAVLR